MRGGSKWNGLFSRTCIQLLMNLIKKSPGIREWIEKGVKKDNLATILHVGFQQLGADINSMQEFILESVIIGAQLSNSNLTEEEISKRVLRAKNVARKIIKNLE